MVIITKYLNKQMMDFSKEFDLVNLEFKLTMATKKHIKVK